MAQKLEKVKAGDLITANFMNTLLSQLENLESRVTALEADGSQPAQTVKITGFEFSQNPLRVGHRLEVKGQNFSVPAELNQVFMNNVKVTSFAIDSGEDQLVFNVPEIPGLAESGTNVTVQVTNPKGSDSDTVKVSPKLIIPQGNIQVTYANGPVMLVGNPNIESNKAYIFTFEVKAIASQQGTYALAAKANLQGWTAELLEDNGDTVRQSNIIALPGIPGAGVTKSIRVRVKVPASQAPGVNCTVHLDVIETTPNTGVTPGNQFIEVIVGQPPPTPEKRVRIMLESAQDAARIDTAKNKVMFKRGQGLGTIGLSLEFTVSDDFTVSTAVKNATGWQIGEVDPSSFKVGTLAEGKSAKMTVLAQLAATQSAAETEMFVVVKSAKGINIKYAQTIGGE